MFEPRRDQSSRTGTPSASFAAALANSRSKASISVHSRAVARCSASARSIPCSAQARAQANMPGCSTFTPGRPQKPRSAAITDFAGNLYTPRKTHSVSSRTQSEMNMSQLSTSVLALAACSASSRVRKRTITLVSIARIAATRVAARRLCGQSGVHLVDRRRGASVGQNAEYVLDPRRCECRGRREKNAVGPFFDDEACADLPVVGSPDAFGEGHRSPRRYRDRGLLDCCGHDIARDELGSV
jgi:hypothetical protein